MATNLLYELRGLKKNTIFALTYACTRVCAHARIHSKDETIMSMKKKNIITLVTLLTALMLSVATSAQEVSSAEQKSVEYSEVVKVYFRQGSSKIDPSYMNNDQNLARLSELLQSYMQTNSMAQGGVGIVATASPEGTNAINTRLVDARAKAITDWISAKCNAKIGYQIEFAGIDWASLLEMVEQNEEVPYRDEILNILRNVPEKKTVKGVVINERQRQIEKLHGGKPYRWLLSNIYPLLRHADVRTDVVYSLELRVVTNSPIEFGVEGGVGEIEYIKSLNDKVIPEVKCDAEWITNIKAQQKSATFEVLPNKMAENRTATIELDYYGDKHNVVVSQVAAPIDLELSASRIVAVSPNGDKVEVAYNINITNASEPKVSSNANWISDVVATNGMVCATVTPNTTTDSRAAVIKVEYLDDVEYIVIRQMAAELGTTDDSLRVGPEKRESVMVYFRQGSSVIDKNYMDNGEHLDRLAEVLETYLLDGAKVKGKVQIHASASPEGSNRINNHLVNARAKAIADWIGKKFNTKIGYEIDFKGIDWQLLLLLVEHNEDVPYRDEVIDIIKNTPKQVKVKGVWVNQRQKKLEALHNGEAYRWLLKNLYPELRYAAVDTYIMYACEITITTESPVRYPAEGGDGVIAFEKNIADKVAPLAYSEADWITDIESTSTEVTYKVQPNPVAKERFSVISLDIYDKVNEVIVEQDAALPILFFVDDVPVEVPAEGAKRSVGYTTNVPENDTMPVAKSESEWLENIVVDQERIYFEAAPNNSVEPRSAVVRVEYFDDVKEFEVMQQGVIPQITITSESPMSVIPEGESSAATYEVNAVDAGPVSATCESEWIENVVVGENVVNFDAQPNTSGAEREAVITVECGGSSAEVVVKQSPMECTSKLRMSLSTNGLYDLLLIPNIGAEIYLGHNLSIDANWHYAWWSSFKKHYFWRTYGGDIALRWWFGESAKQKPLTGHHVGLYGQIITYDFELGGKGILADRWSWAAGVEYGYSLPIAKRLNLDFTVGVGYHGGEFYEYLPIDGHYVWQATKRRQYIGPTKFEVSLVWLIGCDNYNREKGGTR